PHIGIKQIHNKAKDRIPEDEAEALIQQRCLHRQKERNSRENKLINRQLPVNSFKHFFLLRGGNLRGVLFLQSVPHFLKQFLICRVFLQLRFQPFLRFFAQQPFLIKGEQIFDNMLRSEERRVG